MMKTTVLPHSGECETASTMRPVASSLSATMYSGVHFSGVNPSV